MQNTNRTRRREPMSDTQLLLTITICIFFGLYILAMLVWGGGFLRPQQVFDMLNNNAALIIVACSLTIVMICGGIDISVGGVISLVVMACVVFLESTGNLFVTILLALGIAGFVFMMHTGAGNASNAQGMEMDAIASAIIGGTLLSGGVGNIFGTLFGVLTLATIKAIVTAARLNDSWWQSITTGAMLCFFILLQSVVLSMRGKRKTTRATTK